jgi:hypothetical protein
VGGGGRVQVRVPGSSGSRVARGDRWDRWVGGWGCGETEPAAAHAEKDGTRQRAQRRGTRYPLLRPSSSARGFCPATPPLRPLPAVPVGCTFSAGRAISLIYKESRGPARFFLSPSFSTTSPGLGIILILIPFLVTMILTIAIGFFRHLPSRWAHDIVIAVD